MPARTRCPRCETVLNVPEGAERRTLKCPRCLTTFRPGDPGASARSSLPGMDTARPASSSARPAPPRRPPRDEEPDLPLISGDLRDQFGLPLLREAEDAEAGRAASPPRPAAPRPEPGRPAPAPPSSGLIVPMPAGPSPYAEADAAGLIEDDAPPRPRRLGGAEARSAARRCTCGGVVPAGMSICPRCGLDQETGARDLDFDLLDEPPPPPPSPTPFGVLIVGVASALVGAGLTVAAVALYFLQAGAPYRWGFLLLAAVSAFGVYAATRLLRHRSPRTLLAALLLGGLIDVAALIVLPITVASSGPVAEFPEDLPARPRDPDAPADLVPLPRIVPLTERIAWEKVNAGLAILGVTVVVAIYLTSPEVRRYSRGH